MQTILGANGVIGLELSRHLAQFSNRVRQVSRSPKPVAADVSVADEAASEDFTEAELNATVLQQVRDALHRIDDGTYGRCLVDGGAIEAKRLDAVPWAAYCIKHQKLVEAASRPTPATL